MSGTLYLVATPIGNLKDITFRAIETLSEADLIAAEDTRETKKLLTHYKISTPLTSYHAFNQTKKSSFLIGLLKDGKNIALVSDSGTPAISDPGSYLVKEAIENGIKVTSIPGPTASIGALIISGINTDKFVFEGFLPNKSAARQKALERIKGETKTTIFYEAPHRIISTLNDIKDILGERKICLVRELTKKFEEVLYGTAEKVLSELKTTKGEFVLIVEGGKENKMPDAQKLLKALSSFNLPKKDLTKLLCEVFAVPRNEAYKLALISSSR